jgi:SAM-dependent methyltransferase
MNTTFRIIRKLFRLFSNYDLVDNKFNFLINPTFRRKQTFYNAMIQGDDLLKHLKIFTNYEKEKSILDVGCGDGSVVGAFARQNHVGIYHGFDVKKKWIFSLNKLFKNKSNYKFFYFDIFHTYYNKNGLKKPETFNFDLINKNYDLIIMQSIITHMTYKTISNYFKNCKSYLSKNGEIYVTVRLIDDDFDHNKVFDKKFCTKPMDYEGSLTFTPNKPELLLAHKKNKILKLIDENGLKVHNFIEGVWYKGLKSLDQHQHDVFILKHK